MSIFLFPNAEEYNINDKISVKLNEIEPQLNVNQKNLMFVIESLVETTSEVIDSVYNNIIESKIDIEYIYRAIEYAIMIRPHSKESLLTLLKRLSKDFPYKEKYDTLECVRNLLINNEIIVSSRLQNYKSNENLVNTFGESSIEDAIIRDDIELFIKLCTEPSFDANKMTFVNENTQIFYVNEESHVSFIQMIAFYGSIKCFKYALIDGSFNCSDTQKFAVAGGNKEILNILGQKNISLDNCFETGIRFHRHEICDWLLANFKCEAISNIECELYYNKRALFFFEINKIDVPPKSFKKDFMIADSNRNRNIIQSFLNNFINNCGENKWSPLHYASSEGLIAVVRYLVENCGADVEYSDCKGMTSLHYAALQGKLEVVKYLIEKCNANTDVKDKDRKTPIDFAREKNQMNVIDYLTSLNSTPSESVQTDYSHCLCNEIGSKSNEDETPLHIAAYNGHLAVVRFLVEKCGAKVDQKNKKGMIPLHLAAINGHTSVVIYLIEKCGSDVEQEDNKKETALQYALNEGHLPIVQYLIEVCNADIEKKDICGWTALHYASYSCNLQVVKYLVEKCGASIEEKDYDDETPLQHAADCGCLPIVRYLIEKCGAKLNKDSHSLLQDASYNGYLDVVQYFIEKCGVKVSIDEWEESEIDPKVFSYLKSKT